MLTSIAALCGLLAFAIFCVLLVLWLTR